VASGQCSLQRFFQSFLISFIKSSSRFSVMLNLQEYDYELPTELIAQQPLPQKDQARLMVVDCGARNYGISHKHFYDIIDYLQKDDVLVINTSKVVPSRIVGTKSTGSPVEVTVTSSLNTKKTLWKGHIKTNHPKVGNTLLFSGHLSAIIVGVHEDVYEFEFNKPLTPALLKKIGTLPFPSYIRRETVSAQEYQTVYADQEGSVAAPTAGLHFTDKLLATLKKKGVKIAKVCLHVGFGTFLPVREDMIKTRKMRPEWISITKKNCELINQRKGRLFVVGTTTLKTLETVSDSHGKVRPYSGESQLFIFPGYKFNMHVDGFITNFHLPKSSLILLVSAFLGREKILSAYSEAVKEKYRFYSFGDAMLILRK
jgi:S-adenosylmethionine:tRNA ribosyltransferase-isomerase